MDMVKNLLKWLATGLGAVVTLFAIAIMYLLFAVDVNDYRPDIESGARQQGWDITIGGNIAWQVFPKPGLSIANISFSDQAVISGSADSLTLATDWTQLLTLIEGFAAFQPSSLGIESGRILWAPNNSLPLQFDNVQLSTKDLSLLGQQFPLSASATVFGGRQLNLKTDIALSLEGQTIDQLSLSDLQLSLDGMVVSGELSASDNASFMRGNLKTNSFDLKQLMRSLEPAVPLLAAPKTAVQSALTQLSLETSFSLDTETVSKFVSRLSLDGQLFDLDVTIDHPTNNLVTLVSGNLLRASDYLPKANSGSNNSSLFAPLAIPFALWQGRSQVEVNLNRIEFKDFNIENFYSNVFGNQRVLRMTSLNADLFDGQINAIAKLDMRSAEPSFNLQPSLYNIDLVQAMAAMGDNSALSGTLSLDANIQGAGQDVGQMTRSLSGAGQFKLQRPVYKAINLEQTFCNAAALVSGKVQSAQTWPEGTQLEDLLGKFQLSKGKLVVNDYSTGTGNLDIIGRGTVDLIKRQYSLNASARVDQAVTSGTGCSINKKLQNRQIPFVCEGQFDRAEASGLSCKPDERLIRDLLKDSALEKLLDRSGFQQQDSIDPVKSLIKELLKR